MMNLGTLHLDSRVSESTFKTHNGHLFHITIEHQGVKFSDDMRTVVTLDHSSDVTGRKTIIRHEYPGQWFNAEIVGDKMVKEMNWYWYASARAQDA
jgi:hypothetical protein